MPVQKIEYALSGGDAAGSEALLAQGQVILCGQGPVGAIGQDLPVLAQEINQPVRPNGKVHERTLLSRHAKVQLRVLCGAERQGDAGVCGGGIGLCSLRAGAQCQQGREKKRKNKMFLHGDLLKPCLAPGH